MKTRKLTLCALFAAVAVAVNAVEGLIPTAAFMPPGAKLGISNVVTMFVSLRIGLLEALSVALVKSLFVLAARGFSAFVMSLSGGIVSTLACFFMLKYCKKIFGFVGVGIAGALLHNCAQVLVCMTAAGKAVLSYIPFLAVASVVTGTFSGLLLSLTDRYFPKKLLGEDNTNEKQN